MSQLLFTATPSMPTLFIIILLLIFLFAFILLFKQHVLCKKDSINITLLHEDNDFNQELISLIPQFRRNYTPPCCIRNRIPITLLFGILGRFGSRQTNPVAVRQRLHLPDATTVTFDLFLDPPVHDPLLENVILVLLPGISNHSASDYVRAYIEYASSQGFKIACLNHCGSACGERLNPEAPRVHTYGGTGDFSKMIDFLREKYPSMKFIGVGFSVGGNILLKYLGERPERQTHFLCAQSWCQGYDVEACIPQMNKLWSGAKLFNHLISRKKKREIGNLLPMILGGPPAYIKNSLPAANESIISLPVNDESKPMIPGSNHNPDISVADMPHPPPNNVPSASPVPTPQVGTGTPLPSWVPTYAYQREGRERCRRDPSRDTNGYLIDGWEAVPPFDRNEFNRATNIAAVDSSLLFRMLGFQTTEEMYRWCSCAHVLDQIKDVPVLLVNSRNDPLIPWWVVEGIVSNHCNVNEKAIGVVTKHGGHLGYFEGYCCARKRISWADKVSIQHAKSIVQMKLGDYVDQV